MIVRLILKALLVLLVFPALGLLAFNGGFLGAIGTVIVVAIATGLTAFVLFPALATFGLVSVGISGLLGGRSGVFLACFAISTVIQSIALWIAASLMSSVDLLGFWPTIGAGAVLAFVSSMFADKQ